MRLNVVPVLEAVLGEAGGFVALTQATDGKHLLQVLCRGCKSPAFSPGSGDVGPAANCWRRGRCACGAHYWRWARCFPMHRWLAQWEACPRGSGAKRCRLATTRMAAAMARCSRTHRRVKRRRLNCNQRTKASRYGGTYARRDIAFACDTWLNPKFKLKAFSAMTESPQKPLLDCKPARAF